MRHAWVALLLGACAADPLCVPGTTLECICTGAVRGAQVCDVSGDRYGSCDCSGDASTSSLDAAADDAGPLVGLDAGRPGDAGGTPSDAGVVDAAGSGSDAGVDAGARVDAGTDAAVPCPAPYYYDAPTNLCYSRLPHSGGTPCSPPLFRPLRWSTTEEQRRLQGILPSVLGGSAGTDIVRGTTTGWGWSDRSSAPPLIWAPGEPNSLLTYTWMAADGLHSYHRAFNAYFCMSDPGAI